MRVNGVEHPAPTDARRLLSDHLRHDLGLTGTHVGCEHGVCGCCTVLLDGAPVRSCLMLAVQAEGHEVTTIEGLAADGATIETVEGLAAGGELTELQQSFSDHHALQCGYCTPGMLMSATALLRANASPSEAEIKKALQGNICRCTGYWNIVEAVKAVAT